MVRGIAIKKNIMNHTYTYDVECIDRLKAIIYLTKLKIINKQKK